MQWNYRSNVLKLSPTDLKCIANGGSVSIRVPENVHLLTEDLDKRLNTEKSITIYLEKE